MGSMGTTGPAPGAGSSSALSGPGPPSRCRDKEEGRREGVAIARELVDAALEYFQGIYLITPFFHWRMTAELTRHIRERDRRHAAVGE